MKTWKQWFEDKGEIKRLGDNFASVTDGQDRFIVQAAGLDEEMHNQSDDTDEAADEYTKWSQKWTAQQPDDDQWWKFSGDNLQARYGYGTHAEAVQYCEILNRGRDINQYYIQETDREDSDLCDEWNNISDDLDAIHDEEFVKFLDGFADGAEIDRGEADEQWTGYSRQLPDGERRDQEMKGYDEGKAAGEEFAKLYPKSYKIVDMSGNNTGKTYYDIEDAKDIALQNDADVFDLNGNCIWKNPNTEVTQ
jgi:hypothetical protein